MISNSTIVSLRVNAPHNRFSGGFPEHFNLTESKVVIVLDNTNFLTNSAMTHDRIIFKEVNEIDLTTVHIPNVDLEEEIYHAQKFWPL